jgi:hypothetical protein
MLEKTHYIIAWSRGDARKERRQFADRRAAIDFYEGIAGDPATQKATLVEVVESEIRGFEREAGAQKTG